MSLPLPDGARSVVQTWLADEDVSGACSEAIVSGVDRLHASCRRGCACGCHERGRE